MIKPVFTLIAVIYHTSVDCIDYHKSNISDDKRDTTDLPVDKHCECVATAEFIVRSPHGTNTTKTNREQRKRKKEKNRYNNSRSLIRINLGRNLWSSEIFFFRPLFLPCIFL